MRLRRFLVAVLVVLCSREVMPCSIGYSTYLVPGGVDALEMPNAMFDIECRRILGAPEPWEFTREARTSRGGSRAGRCGRMATIAIRISV